MSPLNTTNEVVEPKVQPTNDANPTKDAKTTEKKVKVDNSVKTAIKKYNEARNNKIFIGNWKMNKRFDDIKTFANEFNKLLAKDKVISKSSFLIGIAPTNLGLLPCAGMFKHNVVTVAQNVHFEKEGAFTGQLSYNQIHEYNINYSLVGHSETRKYLNVTDKDVNTTLKAMVSNNMSPILCIGDTKEQYDEKKSQKAVGLQLMNDLSGITEDQIRNVIIAYEPIWAIGATNASSEFINTMVKFIRETISDMYNPDIAKDMHILYGGSVKPENSNEILSINGVDGVLVGGASLDPLSFYEIICSTPEYAYIQKIILTKNGQKPLKNQTSVKHS